jgi:hypothetical protein
VQADRVANLIEHERPLGLVLRAGQALGASGDLDGIGVEDADALQEFPERQFKAVIEAPYDGGIAMVLFARRVEVKDLAHGGQHTTSRRMSNNRA